MAVLAAMAEYEPEIPACSNNKMWCLEDVEYPADDIVNALDQHHEAVLSLYKDVAVNTANPVSTGSIKTRVEIANLCPSLTSDVQPLRAVNVEGEWCIIVNKVESNNYKFDQHSRFEECDADVVNKPCPSVPSCYFSRCFQDYVYRRFLVFDPRAQHFPFAIQSLKVPTSCACRILTFADKYIF